jgi:hypothetical protein
MTDELQVIESNSTAMSLHQKAELDIRTSRVMRLMK